MNANFIKQNRTSSLFPFANASCVRVRQNSVALHFVSRSQTCPGRSPPFNRPAPGSPASGLNHSGEQPGSIENSQLVFSGMPNTGKKAGRPLKSSAHRTKKITARFTEDEYKIIRELEETLGISKTDLVRERLLHGARLTIINAKELVAGLNGIGTELGRSGNNINQLAKYANTLNKQGILSPVVMEYFNQLFASHLENRKQLETVLRRIILSLGR